MIFTKRKLALIFYGSFLVTNLNATHVVLNDHPQQATEAVMHKLEHTKAPTTETSGTPKSLTLNNKPNFSLNAMHLQNQQQECTDVEGWHDSFGPQYDCDYYAEGFNCQLFGWSFSNDGYTANEACCVCGGGNVGGMTDSGTCEDVSGWYDSDGAVYDCDWYEANGACALHGDNFANFGYTANEACCACGGGNVGNPPTPTPPSGGSCQDVSGWYDSDGPEFDCDWYDENGACEIHGDDYENFGYTANGACCACGGGSTGGAGDDGDDEDDDGETTGSVAYGLQPSCHTEDTTKYNMCLDLESLTGEVEPWMEAFAKAKEQWQKTIVGNLPSIASSQLQSGPEFTCTGYPSTVDDVYICGQEMSIDGPSGVLGAAGPLYTRGSGEINPRTGEEYRVALTGRMFFDTADIDMLVDSGEFDEVVFHEMGHVLGIGTLWVDNGLYVEGTDRYVSGTRAEQEWNAIGCSGPLPVETDGGEGTAGGHWDETCLQHEVMSGFLSGPSQPLSSITIGSFEDMGYQVDPNQADSYGTGDLGFCGSFCPEARRGLRKNKERRTTKLELSHDGMTAVMRFAKMELTKIHKEVEASTESQEDNDIRATEDIDVLYRDGNGSMHAVHVTWNQVKDLKI